MAFYLIEKLKRNVHTKQNGSLAYNEKGLWQYGLIN